MVTGGGKQGSSWLLACVPFLVGALGACENNLGDEFVEDTDFAEVSDPESCERICSDLQGSYQTEYGTCSSAGYLVNQRCELPAGSSLARWQDAGCEDTQFYEPDANDCPAQLKLVPDATPNCPEGIVRKEAHSLSAEESDAFLRAWSAVNQRGVVGEFLAAHYVYYSEAHGTDRFLPWHRAFLLAFENQLRNESPCMGLPYWDWGSYSAWPEWLPEQSELEPINVPGNTLLHVRRDQGVEKRFFDEEGDYSLRYYAHTVNLGDFPRYSKEVEEAGHAAFHDFVGGTTGTMVSPFSPGDMVFYLHHAYLDKLWHDWQADHSHLKPTEVPMAAFASELPSAYSDISELGYIYQ